MPSERIQRRIDSLLDEADHALARHEWDVIRARAESVLALDHDNADAKHYLEAAEYALRPKASAVAGNPRHPDIALEQAAVVSPHPSSFANGRYAVKQFLGEGGKKKVYLAHDTVLDRDVAFALIKIEGLDETSRQRITREAQAMGKLGDHPNIVPIFDLGQE